MHIVYAVGHNGLVVVSSAMPTDRVPGGRSRDFRTRTKLKRLGPSTKRKTRNMKHEAKQCRFCFVGRSSNRLLCTQCLDAGGGEEGVRGDRAPRIFLKHLKTPLLV